MRTETLEQVVAAHSLDIRKRIIAKLIQLEQLINKTEQEWQIYLRALADSAKITRTTACRDDIPSPVIAQLVCPPARKMVCHIKNGIEKQLISAEYFPAVEKILQKLHLIVKNYSYEMSASNRRAYNRNLSQLMRYCDRLPGGRQWGRILIGLIAACVLAVIIGILVTSIVASGGLMAIPLMGGALAGIAFSAKLSMIGVASIGLVGMGFFAANHVKRSGFSKENAKHIDSIEKLPMRKM